MLCSQWGVEDKDRQGRVEELLGGWHSPGLVRQKHNFFLLPLDLSLAFCIMNESNPAFLRVLQAPHSLRPCTEQAEAGSELGTRQSQ